MSVNHIFRQLTSGISFNKKAFASDAQRFGLAKPTAAIAKVEEKNVENDLEQGVQLPSLDAVREEVRRVELKRKRSRESDDEDEEENITLLGNITSTKKKKKKKQKVKAERARVQEVYEERVNRFRHVHKIHVTGSDTPYPFDQWSQLADRYQVSENLLKNIRYSMPTPIQMQAIPLMLESREILACAPTGSGKTAAFLLPVLHQLKEPRKGGYRAVVIVPTKELAIQIGQECEKLCQGLGIRPHCLGKVKSERTQPSQPKHDILICPPNRLVYMINHEPPLVNLSKVEWLIIDEADKLFEAGVTGFRDQLATIYKACSGPNIRRGMFSATLGQEVAEWCRLNLDNLVSVRIGALNSATETIEQQLLYCGSEHGKLVAFRDLVQKGLQPPVLVFVQTKERAQELFKELLYDGIHVDVIHSERSEQQRENTVRAFRCGGIWVLICTELMGRGIDFKGVNLVINYDFPPTAVSYIHRIGRTGRAGRPGSAVTFYTDADRPILRTIAQVMVNSGCKVPDYMLHMKTSRDAKRKLAKSAPKRDSISTESKYEKQARLKKEEMVRASKKRKLKMQQKQGDLESNKGSEENAGKQKGENKRKIGGSTNKTSVANSLQQIENKMQKKKKKQSKENNPTR